VAFNPDDRILATAQGDYSVVFWNLSPDERPVEDLLLLSQLLNQQKNRATQSPVTLTTAEVRAAWEQLRTKYPESFASSSEDDYEWHRHGAETCERRELWEEALRHLDWLLQARPDDQTLRSRKAAIHIHRGESLSKRGQHPEAAAAWSAATDLLQQLGDESPAKNKLLQQLATLLLDRGESQSSGGQLAAAAAAYSAANDVLKRLGDESPAKYKAIEQLAGRRNSLGFQLFERTHFQEAETELRAAVDLFRTLVEWEKKVQSARAPLVPNQPRQSIVVTPNSDNLAWSLSRLGMVHRGNGRLKEAEAELASAVEIRRAVLAQNPQNMKARELLAWTLTHAARTALLQKDYPKARRLYEEAEEHARAAVTASPTNAAFRNTMAETLRLPAMMLIARGEHESVPKCVADFLEKSGNSAGATYDAACYLALCVPLAEKDGKLPEAKRKELAQKYAERAVALLRQAIDKGWANAEWMKQDKDLDPIRDRDDFKQCVADLNKKLAPPKK
jgi:tetratricopeptide (TPR) repeat protein